ncbi:hypothetical protein A7C99_4807 [Trichophyton rubrum]|uniref:Uncharacterized protein n=1 Tax=Trichophyton rubrum TaxID=5551 RepID=A0A178EVM1_TRIRU|nr:hypothetical protein A7C99_4807 [Trichophyton rubrum]
MDRGLQKEEGGNGRKAANAASMAKSTSGAANLMDRMEKKRAGRQTDRQTADEARKNNVEEKEHVDLVDLIGAYLKTS